MNKTQLLAGFCLLAAAINMMSCGQGNEPFSTLGDSNALPPLSAPFLPSTASYQVNATGSSGDGYDVTAFPGSGTTLTPLAPETGVVVSVDAGPDAGTSTVTIMHNTRISSRVGRILGTPSVRVGDFLSAGQALGSPSGNVTTAASLRISVIVDGGLVCPYGFYNATARNLIQTRFQSTAAAPYLCNN